MVAEALGSTFATSAATVCSRSTSTPTTATSSTGTAAKAHWASSIWFRPVGDPYLDVRAHTSMNDCDLEVLDGRLRAHRPSRRPRRLRTSNVDLQGALLAGRDGLRHGLKTR
ncbi:hypothetical protein I553_3819 [Mycobacterium xenopi 4042]|uniref:Uncharacterized protein n=1 Tax=Mycobacterium xenopi 4042 TaxID=1299334 RepID=X8A1Q5_MYCXE|nr:hypothetical protein I553_3819 [Mycobacterium xenopi 4042]